MKPKRIVLNNGEEIGNVQDGVFSFDRIWADGFPDQVAIELEAVEQAKQAGAGMLRVVNVTEAGSQFCRLTFAVRTAKQQDGFLLIDEEHFSDTPAEADEYAMRMEREERR